METKNTIIPTYQSNKGRNLVEDSTVWRQQRNLQILQASENDVATLIDPREETLQSLKN